MILFSSRYNLIFSSLLLAALFCSVIVLGIDGHLISGDGIAGGPWAFAIFTVVWTWLSLVGLLVLAFVRPDNLLLQTRFVLANLGLLFVFWLAAAASLTDHASGYLSYCGDGGRRFFWYTYTQHCGEVRALLAFSWITWLLVLPAFAGLLTLAILEGDRNVWSTSVYEYPFRSSAAGHSSHAASSSAAAAEMEQARPDTTAAAPTPMTGGAPAV